MWKKQWKELLGNRVLLISVIVLLFIPIMYAGTFLGSIWDPYGKTENLKIAVINEDKPVEMEGEKLDVGDQLVSNLKKNDSFDWQFVSNKEEANKELRTGDYYMIITIPKDFSKNASTVLDKKPKEMQLNYTTNPGKIMTGDLLGTQGATAVNQTISESVTEQYSKTIFTVIEKMGDGFGEASKASDKLAKGTNTVKDGNKKIATNLEKMADSTLTFQSGSKKLVVGVDALQSGVSQLNTGATKLNTGIGTYTNGVDQLASGSNKLVAGADQLTANSGALNNGASSLANGLSQLQTGSSALQNGVGAVADGNKQLSDGLGQLAGKTPELVDGINQLAEGQKSLTAGLDKMNKNTEPLTNGLASMKDGIDQLSAGLNGTEMPNIDAAKLKAQLTAVGTSLENIAATVQAPDQSDEVKAVANTAAFKAMTPEQQKELMTALQTAVGGKAQKKAASLASAKENLQSVGGTLNALDTEALTQQITKLKAGVAELQAGVNKLAPGSVTLANGIADAHAGSEKLQAGAEQLQASAPTLTGAINSASAASQKLADGASKANAGVGQLATGINSAADGSQTLNNGLSTYTAGVGTLGNGVSTLNGGASKLAANSGQLQSGASQLATGTNQLAEKTPELASGVGQLNEGAGKLHDGATQLADGSNKLTDGLTKVSDGTIKLGDTLGDASTKVSDTNLNPANAKMISKPTDLNHTEISKVPNYGHGLAPYVIALALFVGALTFNVIFPIEVPVAYPKTAVSWWFSKFSVLVVHAVAQALLLDVIMLLFLGLEVDHVGQFVMITVFTSLAYMSIVAFLAITLGNPGRFIAMVLLVIQLGASAGTFPLPLTNGFFQAMHPFMPMTYAVNGYRQAMTSGLSNGVFWQTMGVMVGIVIVFNALLIAVLHLQRKKNYRLDPNEN
ncbi:YhgE/Pip domain-containing protein [Brochothrix thermosphacta]|uniref:YhgE/Pip domain-containing protein n=1 Tax=Brochothrix thermosphacta TaxID=2756 RepID=UPI00265CF044|nr:YhgE/Pip domain-containing protein [Brochothrix thermosphacta]WKK69695.1 YhgE/Pip domain-containing protein [Brochothrix thermosphacta]